MPTTPRTRNGSRPVGVQNGADAKPVLPSPETIADKSYKPLSRPLYIFVKNSACRRPEVKQFLTYYLDNVEKLAVKGGYDPPTDEELKANKAAIAKLYGGGEGAAAKAASGHERPGQEVIAALPPRDRRKVRGLSPDPPLETSDRVHL